MTGWDPCPFVENCCGLRPVLFVDPLDGTQVGEVHGGNVQMAGGRTAYVPGSSGYIRYDAAKFPAVDGRLCVDVMGTGPANPGVMVSTGQAGDPRLVLQGNNGTLSLEANRAAVGRSLAGSWSAPSTWQTVRATWGADGWELFDGTNNVVIGSQSSPGGMGPVGSSLYLGNMVGVPPSASIALQNLIVCGQMPYDIPVPFGAYIATYDIPIPFGQHVNLDIPIPFGRWNSSASSASSTHSQAAVATSSSVSVVTDPPTYHTGGGPGYVRNPVYGTTPAVPFYPSYISPAPVQMNQPPVASPVLSPTPSVRNDPSAYSEPRMPAATSCGNGTLDAAEECDDGNRTDGDGCSGDCTMEVYYAVDAPDSPLAAGLIPSKEPPQVPSGTPASIPQGLPKTPREQGGEAMRQPESVPSPARTSTGPGLIIFLVSGAAAGVGLVRRKLQKA
ncbi:MAG: myxococcus cysteine-rich repeat containing protein [Candidatus Peribacteraceae bacterium]|nr:myxococcus cysteine-rich repeat containing protein [Candidatus Peribacteraceae bacterium]